MTEWIFGSKLSHAEFHMLALLLTEYVRHIFLLVYVSRVIIWFMFLIWLSKSKSESALKTCSFDTHSCFIGN